jgi:hypothetical protein
MVCERLTRQALIHLAAAAVGPDSGLPEHCSAEHLFGTLMTVPSPKGTCAQVGGYARPPYRKAATLSDRSPKPFDVTDWVWAAGGGDDLDGPHHSMPARSHAPHRRHWRMLPLRGS